MRVKGVLGLAILAAVLCVSGNVFAVLSGSGTEASPYLIQSRADFDEFADSANAELYWASGVYTKLMCNLDLSDTTYTQAVIAPDTNSVTSSFQGTQFAGVFDGNSHILSNLMLNQPTKDYIGLFGCVGSGGQIRNLGVENVNLTGRSRIGGLVGGTVQGLITGCYVTGSVNGSSSDIGGLAGWNGGTINYCYATSSVSGGFGTGGLVGGNSGEITFCYATGVVNSSSYAAGGLSGYDRSGGIASCFWDMGTSGLSVSGGGTGKTTAQMKDIQTYLNAGWSIIQANNTLGDWVMPDNGYPKLAWEVYSLVTIPNIKGLTDEQGRAALDAVGLLTGESYFVYDVSITAGLVSETYPKAGTVVNKELTPPIRILLAKDTKYSGGDGITVPYQITYFGDWNDLMSQPTDWNKSFILTATIDLGGLTFAQSPVAPDTSATGGFQGTPFTGIFDGNGNTISNLTIAASSKDYIGLFGIVGSGGQVSNLGVACANVAGRYYVGEMVGYSEGSLTSCYATGLVRGTSSDVGGLVGHNRSNLTSCYATGSVSGNSSVGGLAGLNVGGTLTSCYATGSVSGNSSVGGLAGLNVGGTLTSCYATGLVIGNSDVGGLVGGYSGTMTTFCFWDIQTSGQSRSSGGKGLTTEQMKTLSIYQNAGWAGKGWVMNDGVDYPRLSWENTGGVSIPLPQAISLVGNGTAENPYLISTPQEFAMLSWHSSILDKQFRLTANLDLSGITLYPIGDLGPFIGVFDGNGHTVSNVVIHQPGNDYVGLFGDVGSGGQIRSLGLENVDLTGRSLVGGLVGLNGGSLTSCYATGSVSGTGSDIGGLVGYSYGMLTACSATGSVSGDCYVGGLVGSNSGSISACYATGSVSGTGNYVGGLVGENYYAMLTTCCYATGSVSGVSGIGGLVGRNNSSLTSCYTTGSVSGTGSNIGGLVGFNNYGWLTCCYATGSVTGNSSVGGLAGGGYYSTLTDCFWDTTTSNTTDGVGCINPDPAGVVGKSTSDMKIHSTFTDAGWDFTNETANGSNDTWRMCADNVDTPRLNWESIEGDFACPEGVGTEDLDYTVGRWLRDDCTSANNFCGGADMNFSGIVDLADFAIFAAHWMEGS